VPKNLPEPVNGKCIKQIKSQASIIPQLVVTIISLIKMFEWKRYIQRGYSPIPIRMIRARQQNLVGMKRSGKFG
jgi:hypothetical protein